MQIRLNNGGHSDTFSGRDELEELLQSRFSMKIPEVNSILKFCTENKCSDLYLKVGQQPFINRYGRIYRVPSMDLTHKIWNDWAKEAITSENNAKYVRAKMLDFSYTLINNTGLEDQNEYRYRVSAGFSMGKNIATFRMITPELPSFSGIKFPQNVAELLKQMAVKKQGIVLFVGVTGSGKTTTFASCINDFSKDGGPFENTTIIALEDPIEYQYQSTSNFNILQKELGTDFKDFASGVKQSLREHPNFVNVGETRDSETVETLVEGARTGHGVWSSFHASDVGDTISRMYNMLYNGNSSVMYDVIANMNFILCQRLVAAPDGFQLLTQYMVFTDEIKKYLSDCIDRGDNIPKTINLLFQKSDLLQSGVIQDWK